MMERDERVGTIVSVSGDGEFGVSGAGGWGGGEEVPGLVVVVVVDPRRSRCNTRRCFGGNRLAHRQ